MTEGTPAPPFRMPSPGELAQRPMPGPPPVPGPPVPGPPPVSAPEPDQSEAEADDSWDSAPVEPVAAPRSGGTGDDRVDAALRRLDGLDELPISEHVEQYDAVHRTLQDALAAIDEG